MVGLCVVVMEDLTRPYLDIEGGEGGCSTVKRSSIKIVLLTEHSHSTRSLPRICTVHSVVGGEEGPRCPGRSLLILTGE